MSVEIKLGTCYYNGNRCTHNGSCVCTRCGVLSGNVNKPILFEPEMIQNTIDISKCKKKGNPGEFTTTIHKVYISGFLSIGD